MFPWKKKTTTEPDQTVPVGEPADAPGPQSGDSGETTTPAQRGKGWFARAVEMTRRALNTDIRDLFGKTGRLVDDEFLGELFAILVRTDMGAQPAKAIRERIQNRFRGRKVEMADVLGEIREELKSLLAQPDEPIAFADQPPTVIMVVGVNGSGKTTSIAKLTHLFKSQGKQVVLGAADTFRAAAVEQLAIWADRLSAQIVRGKDGGDPASVAHQAVALAVRESADVCIIDTAGRLQTQRNLMKELEKIRRVIQTQVGEAPHEVLLVLDATAGQNGISQAKGFSEAAGCTGIVLAKLDGTAKGGVIVPIRQEFGIPVKYIGLGEKPEDLALFNADAFLADLFDVQ